MIIRKGKIIPIIIIGVCVGGWTDIYYSISLIEIANDVMPTGSTSASMAKIMCSQTLTVK